MSGYQQGGYCDYSGIAHGPVHDQDPHSGSPMLDRWRQASNPRANTAPFLFEGRVAVRRKVRAAFPKIKAEAVCKGMKAPSYTVSVKGLKLLSSSKKVEKGSKKGVATTVLYLSPSTEAYTEGFVLDQEAQMEAKARAFARRGKPLPTATKGFRFKGLCTGASKECSDACLGHGAGQLAMDGSKNARLTRTILHQVRPSLFFELLYSEIDSFIAAAKRGKPAKGAGRGKRSKRDKSLLPAIRLDGSSDLGLAQNVAKDYPGVQFYDYTKRTGTMFSYLSARDERDASERSGRAAVATTPRGKAFPDNWHLTYSYSGKNKEECLEILRRGGNVAVVFNASPLTCDSIPATWNGYSVVDGDETDVRFMDEVMGQDGLMTKRGIVVGLRFKMAAARTAGMKQAGDFVTYVDAPTKRAGPFTSEGKARKYRDGLTAADVYVIVDGIEQEKTAKNKIKRKPGAKSKSGRKLATHRGEWYLYFWRPENAEKTMLPRLEKNPAGVPVSAGAEWCGEWPHYLADIHGGQGDPVYALGSRLQAYGGTLASREELGAALTSFESVLAADEKSSVFSSDEEYSRFQSAADELRGFMGNAGLLVSMNPRKRKVDPRAFEARDRYREDMRAGHGAAEYWRGQAGAFFTANNPVPKGIGDPVFSTEFRPVSSSISFDGYSSGVVTTKTNQGRGSRQYATLRWFMEDSGAHFGDSVWSSSKAKAKDAHRRMVKASIASGYKLARGRPVMNNPLLAIVGNPLQAACPSDPAMQRGRGSRCISGQQIKLMLKRQGVGPNLKGKPLLASEVAKAMGVTTKDVTLAMKVGIPCAGRIRDIEHLFEGIQKASDNRVAGAGTRGRLKSKGKKKAPRVKKNRVASKHKQKKPLRKKRYSLKEAAGRFDGYDEALAAFKEFHGSEPGIVDVYALDDGKDAVRVEPVNAALYRQLETNYMVPWSSNKKGTLWKHEHKEGHGLSGLEGGKAIPNPSDLPLGIYNPTTKAVTTIGGKMQVRDWLYD